MAQTVKNPPANAGDPGLTPEWERAPEEGNGCLENSMDRGTWQATVHEVAKKQTQLSD